MSNYNYEVLPRYINDDIIDTWDYNENGRWGLKQYIRCWICLIFCFIFEIFILVGLFELFKNTKK